MHLTRFKFRNVYGEELAEKFESIKPSLTASEGHLIKANGSFVAFSAEIGGGGALALLSMRQLGRQAPNFPLIKGHSSKVIDYDFNPFNDNQILSCSDDATLKLWGYPDEGLTEDLETPLQTLTGHAKKVSLVSFHPCASYVAASTSYDHTIKLWNIETGAVQVDIQELPDIAMCLSWNYEGSLIATTNKDKHVRIFDARSKAVTADVLAHEGSKPAKFCWLDPDLPKFFTVGFSRMSGRQYSIWDHRSLSAPMHTAEVDSASGVLMPFYDTDTKMMYLAGKGDGNIRYYEITADAASAVLLESFKSAVPCRGVTFIPKRRVDTGVNEVMRAFKITSNTVDIISFRVPRRSEAFQDDIYPDVVSAIPALTGARWFEGETKQPLKEPIRSQSSTSPLSATFYEASPTTPLHERPEASKEPISVPRQSENAEKLLALEVERKRSEDKQYALEAELQHSTREKDELRARLQMKEKQLAAVSQQTDLNSSTQQGDQVEELKAVLEVQQTNQRGLESRLVGLEDQLQQTRVENAQLEQAMRHSANEVEEFKAALDKAHQDAALLKQSQSEELDRRAMMQSKAEILEQQVKESEVRNTESQTRIADLSEELNHVKALLEASRASLMHSTHVPQLSETEAENLKAALDKAVEENLASKAQQSQSEEEKLRLQDQLAELQRKTEEQGSLVDQLQNRLAEVQNQLEASRQA
jgi:coronin-1B/1C/6